MPQQLSVAAIERLLDPLGRNISFGDKWVDRARNELAPRFAAKVTALSPPDLRLLVAAEKVRNAIAHQSRSSIGEMNTALVVLDAVTDADLIRGNNIRPTGIAPYLHAAPSADRRVEIWHRRLREVASKLTVGP